jgi:hypothetical protein
VIDAANANHPHIHSGAELTPSAAYREFFALD